MDLKNLASEFAKAVTPKREKAQENALFGTVVKQDDELFVQLDGSDQLMPVESTVELAEGQRVTVTIKDHKAIADGCVSDKSITRTTADGLIDVFAHDGTFSGTLSAPVGNIGGWSITGNVMESNKYSTVGYRSGLASMGTNSTENAVAFYAGCANASGVVTDPSVTNFYVTHGGKIFARSGTIGGWSLTESALYRGSSTFGNASGMYLGANGFSVMDRFKVDKNGFVTIYNPGVLDDGSSVPYTFKFNHDSGFVIECKSGGVNRNMFGIYAGENNKTPTITSSQGFINIRPDIETNGHITIQNSTAAIKAYDSNGTARNLMYMTSGDNVSINGDGVGNTVVGSPLVTTGTITSNSHIYWGGATGWNGGKSGGFGDTTGQMCIISDTSSRYPRINFVVNKKTSSAGYTQLRANNTSTTTNYTLTLPNSTGTIATSSSDVRLKKNIEDTEVNGLELISKIRLRQFDWKEEGHEGSPHWNVGMIADELEGLDKNLVFGGGENEDGTMNVKGVDSFYLIGYLVKAVQELSAEVERLKGGGKND